jgi:signal transduction histidine kinase
MGISRFDYRNKQFSNLSASDGLQSNEFTKASILTTQNGAILAGGTNGFNLIHPERKSDNRMIPQLNLTDIHIFNGRVTIGSNDSPLKSHISVSDEITLSYKQSVITFFFSVMDFTNPQKNQYAYMMENFDKGWVYSGNKREATYTNLNPGRYTFRVKGSNNDGVWNEEGVSLTITITPPWWATTIARVSFALFLISLFAGIYILRVSQLNHQRKLLEKLVKERTHEIEDKNVMLERKTAELNKTNSLLEERQQYIQQQAEELASSNNQLKTANATKDTFFSIIAHDLRNPFNNILGFTELLSNNDPTIDDEKIKKITSQLYKSASNTYNLLENLLEWSKTQSNKITFEPQLVDLREICLEVIENMSLNSKNINIVFSDPEKIEVFADINMIKTILRNLISNAIKFSFENSIVNLSIEKNDRFATVTVSDKGVGIEKKNLSKLFDLTQKYSTQGTASEKGTGLGLIICKEFIVKHNGEIWVASDTDSHRGGKGTTIKFSIPFTS